MNASTFLLLHGAWHDASCWRLLSPFLRERGHAVIAPDLPGHGSSTLPPARATLKAYTQSVLELIEQSRSPLILVGHSMAGMVITEVAARVPEKIAALVYLCAYLPQPGDSVFSLIARNRGHEPLTPIELAMEISEDKRTCSVNASDIVPLFYTEVPVALAERARETFAHQGTLPLAAGSHYDPSLLAALRRVYICCTRDKVIPLHHQRRMLAALPEIEVAELDSDHSPFYSCPEQLAALLDSLTC